MITILFYPDIPVPNPLSRVYRIINSVDWITYHHDPREEYNLHFFWSYTKHSITPDRITLRDTQVINRGCWDISKQKVHGIYNDIAVDPQTCKLPYVQKLDQQSVRIHHKLCYNNQKAKPGFVYEQFIKNKEGRYFVSYRLYYAEGIKVVKKRLEKSLFRKDFVHREIINKRECFTPEQEHTFNRQCREFGIDFGAIDFQMKDGIPVILDVNNVEGGGIKQAMPEKMQQYLDQILLDYIKVKYSQL